MNILRLRARTIMVLLITTTACTTSYTTRGVQTTAATAIINNGESAVYRSSISFHGEKGYYPMTGVKTESELWIDAISDVSSVLGTDVLENYYHSCLAEGGYRSHYFYYYTLKLLFSEEERFDFQSGNLCCHRKEGKIQKMTYTWSCHYGIPAGFTQNQWNNASVDDGVQNDLTGSKVYYEHLLSVVKYPQIEADQPIYTLYDNSSSYDVFLESNRYHIIKRLPTVEDLGLFWKENTPK